MNDFLRQFFWPLITSLAIVAALINFGLAWSRRKAPMVMLVRIIAGLASLALGLVIILGKNLGLHPVKVVLHPEVSVTVTANVAQSAEEAEMQAKGIDPLRLRDEEDQPVTNAAESGGGTSEPR